MPTRSKHRSSSRLATAPKKSSSFGTALNHAVHEESLNSCLLTDGEMAERGSQGGRLVKRWLFDPLLAWIEAIDDERVWTTLLRHTQPTEFEVASDVELNVNSISLHVASDTSEDDMAFGVAHDPEVLPFAAAQVWYDNNVGDKTLVCTVRPYETHGRYLAAAKPLSTACG
ncbi:Aste57867_15185 [Aphanomyces stellatus]|uniref:Aste57867_15185 protein n=1 Tax=Aphanomyces stellatus TaxID=120398 RepID=A0A485L5F6_9STRA|nr:hypothetical protein As57867_015129 [Aphanomyces stellatus]VFT91994.1 Aste57867_15185 [Aphanomyces stellatus]